MATEARNHANRPIFPALQRIMPEQAKNQNSHPDNLGIPQFCLFTFNFCLPSFPLAALQLSRNLYKRALFMQYKPNLQENQVNATSVLAKGYEDDIVFWPKNPKANFLNAKMNISYAITKNYENARLLGREKTKPNSKPIKPNQSQFQTQNKPNFMPQVLVPQVSNPIPRPCRICQNGTKKRQSKFEKKKPKKLNLLICKRLGNSARLRCSVGTSFAYPEGRTLYILTDNKTKVREKRN